jgi:hypothetical protein
MPCSSSSPPGLSSLLGGGAFQAWRRWSDNRRIRKHLRQSLVAGRTVLALPLAFAPIARQEMGQVCQEPNDTIAVPAVLDRSSRRTF